MVMVWHDAPGTLDDVSSSTYPGRTGIPCQSTAIYKGLHVVAALCHKVTVRGNRATSPKSHPIYRRLAILLALGCAGNRIPYPQLSTVNIDGAILVANSQEGVGTGRRYHPWVEPVAVVYPVAAVDATRLAPAAKSKGGLNTGILAQSAVVISQYGSGNHLLRKRPV